MTAVSETVCPLCQSEKTVPRHRIRIPELGTAWWRSAYAVAIAARCLYPSLAELEHFYSKEYFEGEPGGRGFDDYLPKSYARIGEGWLSGASCAAKSRTVECWTSGVAPATSSGECRKPRAGKLWHRLVFAHHRTRPEAAGPPTLLRGTRGGRLPFGAF